MTELGADEISEVSGGGIFELAAWVDAFAEFAQGFVDGAKAGYHA